MMTSLLVMTVIQIGALTHQIGAVFYKKPCAAWAEIVQKRPVKIQ